MPIICKNDPSYKQVEQISPTELKIFVSRFIGVLLYIDYKPGGDESEVVLKGKARDSEDTATGNQNKYYYVSERDISTNIISHFKVRLTNPDTYIIPIPVGGSTDELIIEAEFVGSSGNDGDLEIYARIENSYSS